MLKLHFRFHFQAVNQPINPLLANGQFPTRVRINLAEAQQQPELQPQQLPSVNTNFVRGQFHVGSRNLQQQLINGNILQQRQPQRPAAQAAPLFQSSNAVQFPESNRQSFMSSSSFSNFGSPANFEIIDEADLPDLRFKRSSEKKTNKKRELVTLTDGSIVDDSFFDTDWYDGLAQFGSTGLKQSLTKRDNIEDQVKEHDREPAEGEVDAVRSFCNYCLLQPFQTALVLAWKSASASHGVLKASASTTCANF